MPIVLLQQALPQYNACKLVKIARIVAVETGDLGFEVRGECAMKFREFEPVLRARGAQRPAFVFLQAVLLSRVKLHIPTASFKNQLADIENQFVRSLLGAIGLSDRKGERVRERERHIHIFTRTTNGNHRLERRYRYTPRGCATGCLSCRAELAATFT